METLIYNYRLLSTLAITKMKINEEQEKRKIDKFKLLHMHKQGGIFTQKTIERIITKRGLSGRSKDVNTFWYRQRENVKTALVDLQLFIEEAGKSNVKQVVTADSLNPIVYGLLDLPIGQEKIPDQNLCEIAKLFIEAGFRYLSGTQEKYMTRSHEDTVTNALDLARFLAKSNVLEGSKSS